MSQKELPKGTFVIWKWGDPEIENSGLLRKQLLEISSRGFSGVLASLSRSRYEFIDPKVVRAMAQASQWANKRNIAFWFQVDPRQASRTFISRTGERTENLIVAHRSGNGLSQQNVNIAKIENNRFNLRYEIPKVQSDRIREVSLQFEPCGLERAFLFQMENGSIIKDTIHDVSETSHFFSNIDKGYAEVFGDVQTPDDETWWSMAFPKFSTNLYDFAGRASNDLLLYFVEDVFDACTHLDGITWGEGEIGYIADMGRFPVSLSLYNSFIAEYGYDLRDVLYSLILPVDDKSHTRIRYDYYSLLMNMVFGAQSDFYRVIHSFFSVMDVGIHHTWHFESHKANDLIRGSLDPWQSLKNVSHTFIEMGDIGEPERAVECVIPTLIIAKSLGVFSESYHAFVDLTQIIDSNDTLSYWVDLMSLFSVQWLAQINGQHNHKGEIRSEHMRQILNTTDLEKINERIRRIRDITGYQYPKANTALIYPIETIASIGSQDADEMIKTVNRFAAKLVMEGIQLDMISSHLLREARLTADTVSIRDRQYDTVIFPYPEVLHPDVLETVSLIHKSGLPILLGGCTPQFTSTGKRIPPIFKIAFDPHSEDVIPLQSRGIKPLFQIPQDGLATLIQREKDELLLLCPKVLGGSVEGKIEYGSITIDVAKSSGLLIFKLEGDHAVQVL